MRVLVTGAAGFIGAHVVEFLLTGRAGGWQPGGWPVPPTLPAPAAPAVEPAGVAAAGEPSGEGGAAAGEGRAEGQGEAAGPGAEGWAGAGGPGGAGLPPAVPIPAHDLLAVDDFSAGRTERVAGVSVERLDITDAAAVAAVLRDFRPDAVIHLAAQVSVERSLERPDLDVDVNVYGTLNLLRAAVAAGTRRVVFASSAAVYGNPQRLPVDEDHPLAPLSVYGRSKQTAEWLVEQYARGAGLEAVVLRLGNVYGPGQRPETGPVVARFFLDALTGEGPVIHGDGRQTRDFVYVADVARAFALALTGPAGITVNVAGGMATAVGDLARRICQLVQGAPALRYGPPRPGDIRHSVLANDRARRLLGWAPAVDLDAGLAATFRWYREQVVPDGASVTLPVTPGR
ncbi:NAD-dependent epimerase/dehydratase family protein [Thermaerobacter litoralis]